MRLIYIFEMGSIVSYETHTTSAIRGQRAIIRSRHHKLKLSKKKKKTSAIRACFVHLVDTKADAKVNVNGKAKSSGTNEVISIMYLHTLPKQG